jgi:hypothetical protein
MAVSLSGQGNRLYPYGKLHLLEGNIDIQATSPLAANPICVALVSTDYDPQSDDQFYSTAINTPGYEVATTPFLTSNVLTSYSAPEFIVRFGGNDMTWLGVAAGSTINKVVIYREGTPGVDDYLIGLFMTGSAGPFSVVTNNGNITISWDSNGIFRL